MSPPCQPFTRNGKYLDENDSRTDSFRYLISILDQLESVEYILMENVKGFECSSVRDIFIDKLKECKFKYQEFLLSPSAVGVPNSRLRYYCIARKNLSWNFKTKDGIVSIFQVIVYNVYLYSGTFSRTLVVMDQQLDHADVNMLFYIFIFYVSCFSLVLFFCFVSIPKIHS